MIYMLVMSLTASIPFRQVFYHRSSQYASVIKYYQVTDTLLQENKVASLSPSPMVTTHIFHPHPQPPLQQWHGSATLPTKQAGWEFPDVTTPRVMWQPNNKWWQQMMISSSFVVVVYIMFSSGQAHPVPDSFFFVITVEKAFYVQILLLNESLLMSIVVITLSS